MTNDTEKKTFSQIIFLEAVKIQLLFCLSCDNFKVVSNAQI
jgi:hypothetical protein